jgi:hypothetical protein
MSAPGKIRALLATARVANVPSVVCNVWCGMALAWSGSSAAAPPVILVPLAGVLLYVSGNFLNDWFDRHWDATRRPERALPGGLWRPGTYLAAAVLLGTGGIALALMAGPRPAAVAAIIAMLVVVYTVVHKRSVWSVLPMGLCRALLPVMGALAVLPVAGGLRISMLPSLALLGYIAGLSLEARNEALASGENKTPGIWPLGLLAVAAPISLLDSCLRAIPWLAVLAALPLLGWLRLCRTRYRRPVPRLVSALLAGIPLVDWVFLLPHGLSATNDWPGISMIAVPPLAMGCALLLQRLAPAT